MEVVQLICHKDGRTWSERKSFNILICFTTSCSTIEAAHGLETLLSHGCIRRPPCRAACVRRVSPVRIES